MLLALVPVVPKDKPVSVRKCQRHIPVSNSTKRSPPLPVLPKKWALFRTQDNESTKQVKSRKGIWLVDAPKPVMGHNDLLIKIKNGDLWHRHAHLQLGRMVTKTIPVPMVVGHEYVGEVVDIGQEVRGFKIGDRVSGEGHITCGHCRNCRAGRTHLCRNTSGVGVNREGSFANT